MIMLRVDLGRLGREGSVLVETHVPADDRLWRDSDLVWASDVDVCLAAAFVGTGEVVVRGTVGGVLEQVCRRCLRPVSTDFEDEVTLVFAPGQDDDDSDEGGSYVFEPEGAELDLSGGLREEVLLVVNPYVVCEPECRGLCSCGANLNEGPCDCSDEEPDPRWDALQSQKDK